MLISETYKSFAHKSGELKIICIFVIFFVPIFRILRSVGIGEGYFLANFYVMSIDNFDLMRNVGDIKYTFADLFINILIDIWVVNLIIQKTIWNELLTFFWF